MKPFEDLTILPPDTRLLFAAESGSRAWGFESPDSDFDVRFVYQKPLEWYLRVHEPRDVIESLGADPVMDYSGWELRKFFRLLAKSNPSCFEWLQSDIVYAELEEWGVVRQLAPRFFSAKAAGHHYLSMAKHNYHEHMRDGDSPSVRLKKYLYITRPLLCCRWLEAHRMEGPPPMRFMRLLDEDLSLTTEVFDALVGLRARKMAGDELAEGAAVPCLNAFIDHELDRFRAVIDEFPTASADIRELDEVLYSSVT